MTNPSDSAEKTAAQTRKRLAAEAALRHIEPDTVLGVGTGSTVAFLIEALAKHPGLIRAAVSSSNASTIALRAAGITVLDLNEVEDVPLYIDGADQATRNRCLIKGGGGALTREKIIASAARRFICVVDDSKLVDTLGAFPLPIEVIPMARALVARTIESHAGHAVWRTGYVTDNGNHILDVHGLSIRDPLTLERQLGEIAGVVTVGLFAARPADLLLVGTATAVEQF